MAQVYQGKPISTRVERIPTFSALNRTAGKFFRSLARSGEACEKSRLSDRGDSLVLKVCSAHKQFQAITQELDPDLYHELNLLQSEVRANEAAVRTRWLFNGIHLFMLQTLAGGNKSWL
jgi:hypothetical protein